MENAPTLRHLGQHLSDVDIGKVLGLAKAELPQREIADLMNCSKNAVQHTVETYDFDTFQGRNPRREYERKTTKREDRYIERALKQNNSLPLRDITNITALPVSRWTVARRRSEIGLGSYIAANKPGLRDVNVDKRLEWAMKYKDWTVDDWKRVIWSDETILRVGVNPRRQWVIRPKNERLNPKYVNKTFKGEHVNVMVWACFTGDRLGPLIVCDQGGIGADEYEDIIYDGLFSLIDDLLEPPEDPRTIQIASRNTYIFMQDNAPCHKSTDVLEFLRENRVPVMEWPPQSPDLNPIENLWVPFKAAFHKRFTEMFNHPSKSLEARYRYAAVLQEVWYAQGRQLVDALIESMPKRVQAVIEANGGWTKY
jgi:DDE superfamily endonuclease/Transposase